MDAGSSTGAPETASSGAEAADLSATSGGTSVATEAAAESSAAVPAANGEIDFLFWQGYDLPKPMAAWKRAHDIKINASYISNHDEIQAKLANRSGSFDPSPTPPAIDLSTPSWRS